ELRRAGAGEALEACFDQLGIVLARSNAILVGRRSGAIAEAGIRTGRRLPVDHIYPLAIAAEAHRVRIPTRRDETNHLIAAISSAQRHHRYGIQIAVR